MGHNNLLNLFGLPASFCLARAVPVVLVLLGLMYVSTMGIDGVPNVFTPRDVHAMQQPQATPGAVDYFPARYVNQAQAKAPEEHIQAF